MAQAEGDNRWGWMVDLEKRAIEELQVQVEVHLQVQVEVD